MTTALGIILGSGLGLIARFLVDRWRRRRAEAPAPTELCEVCAKPLTERQTWELRAYSTDDASLVGSGFAGGGTYVAATYCHQHAPEGARRSIDW